MTAAPFDAMLQELLALPQETEWVEFKHNYVNPQDIGGPASATVRIPGTV